MDKNLEEQLNSFFQDPPEEIKTWIDQNFIPKSSLQELLQEIEELELPPWDANDKAKISAYRTLDQVQQLIKRLL